MKYEIRPNSYRVKDIPARERPRELLDRFGVESVPDEVLLAVVLRSGVKGRNVVEIARDLIRDYGSLTEIARAGIDELAGRRGMGKTKAQVLRCSFELARRLSEEDAGEAPAINSPEDAAGLLREKMRVLDKESFYVLLLDAKNRMKQSPVEVTRGILNASLVHPREIYREAIRTAAAAVVLAHNHPSGDPMPSTEDVKLTRQLIEAGKIVGIDVIDHVIIGKRDVFRQSDFFSMREQNVVKFE